MYINGGGGVLNTIVGGGGGGSGVGGNTFGGGTVVLIIGGGGRLVSGWRYGAGGGAVNTMVDDGSSSLFATTESDVSDTNSIFSDSEFDILLGKFFLSVGWQVMRAFFRVSRIRDPSVAVMAVFKSAPRNVSTCAAGVPVIAEICDSSILLSSLPCGSGDPGGVLGPFGTLLGSLGSTGCGGGGNLDSLH